jgi:hypothetical protein
LWFVWVVVGADAADLRLIGTVAVKHLSDRGVAAGRAGMSSPNMVGVKGVGSSMRAWAQDRCAVGEGGQGVEAAREYHEERVKGAGVQRRQ